VHKNEARGKARETERKNHNSNMEIKISPSDRAENELWFFPS
jgi:hypothetical protein